MLSERARAAYLANLKQAGPLTAAGRERLRAAARRNQPWKHSTGPLSAAGKARSRMNAYKCGDFDALARALDLYLSDIRVFGLEYARGLEAVMDGEPEGAVLAEQRMTRARIRLQHGQPAGDFGEWIAQHRLLLAKYPR